MTPEEINEKVSGLSYDEAINETERVLAQLENEELPIDQVLSASRYVVALIAHCRAKITDVGKEVESILTDLDPKERN